MSLNLKTNLVGMTVVLHKHKIACGKHGLFTYICCRKALGQLQYHFIILQFSQKNRYSNDIAIIRVSFYNKYMYKQHVFRMRFYVYATQQSLQQGRSLNLKNRKSINLQTTHIYMDSL